MKVLVTGGEGQLGSVLTTELLFAGFDALSLGSSDLDITNSITVSKLVDSQIDFIINTAAYTAVDRAESEPGKAYAVNKLGVENLVRLAKQLAVPLVNISTDFVFDGTSETAYLESDARLPINAYGKSKLAGEVSLESAEIEFINLRTSWVFGENGTNFVKTMLRLAKIRNEISIVSDQLGCPTYSRDIAVALVHIAKEYRDKSRFESGHYHFCGDVSVSWYGFAEQIFSQSAELGIIDSAPALKPISTAEYPVPASRPANSVLNCQKIQEIYGLSPSDWRLGLSKVLKSLPQV